jgi:hypothetical protein
MTTWIDSHPRLTAAVIGITVVGVGFGAIFFLALLEFSPELILIIAPVAAIATAGAFLYIARNTGRQAEVSEMPVEPEESHEPASAVPELEPSLELTIPPSAPNESRSSTEISSAVENEPAFSVEPAPVAEGASLVPELQAEPIEFQSPEVIEPNTISAIDEEPAEQDSTPPTEGPPPEEAIEPAAAMEILMDEIQNKIGEPEVVVASADNTSVVTTEVSTVPEESSSVSVVDRTKQQIARKDDQRCIIISAPNHGMLQDRLNNWLSSGTGRVVHASMASDGKGFYLTIFYEPY